MSGGCLDVLTGAEPIKAEARAAMVSSSVASDTGFKLTDTASPTITREISAGGETRTVEVTNKIATYEKTMAVPPIGEQNLASFAAIATPAVDVFGKTLNPVGDYSHAELVNLLASEYEGLSNVRRVGSRNTTVLSTETTVSKFASRATFDGQPIDVYIHVTRVQNKGEFVIPIGIYPQKKSDEARNIILLMGAVNHPTSF